MVGTILPELRVCRVEPTPAPHLRTGQLGQEERGKTSKGPEERARGGRESLPLRSADFQPQGLEPPEPGPAHGQGLYSKQGCKTSRSFLRPSVGVATDISIPGPSPNDHSSVKYIDVPGTQISTFNFHKSFFCLQRDPPNFPELPLL